MLIRKQVANLAISSLVGFKRGQKQDLGMFAPVGLALPDS